MFNVEIKWSDEVTAGKSYDCVAVIDVLRASTTTIAALEHGAKEVMVMKEQSDALKLSKKTKASIACGEEGGMILQGFDANNSPLFVTKHASGKTVVLCSGNFSFVLSDIIAKNPKATVICCALTNAKAVAQFIIDNAFVKVLLVPVGTYHFANKKLKQPLRLAEDLMGAYAVMHEIQKRFPVDSASPLDAKTQKLLSNKRKLRKFLLGTDYARYLLGLGDKNTQQQNRADVEYCFKYCVSDTVPVLASRKSPRFILQSGEVL